VQFNAGAGSYTAPYRFETRPASKRKPKDKKGKKKVEGELQKVKGHFRKKENCA